MCGRSTQPPPEKLKWHYEPGNYRDANVGGVSPGHRIFALVQHQGVTRLSGLHWGWSAGRDFYNARVETMHTLPMWKDEVAAKQRCIIPVEDFTESGRHFGAADGEILAVAGLYRLDFRPPTCTMLTRPADDMVSAVHTRMPVLLADTAVARWLGGDDFTVEELTGWVPPLQRVA